MMMVPELPLAGVRCCLVGPGRVGSTLVRWLAELGAAVTVAGRRRRRDEQLGVEVVAADELESASSELLLVSVPDAALGEVASTLAARPQAPVVLHTSGRAPATVLSPLRSGGAEVGGFHPLRAFAAVSDRVADAAGTFFAVSGDPGAIAMGRRLATAFGGRAEVVADADRPLYHLAAVLSAGGVVSLLEASAAISRHLGLGPGPRAGYLNLARGALRACDPEHPVDALTGPVARAEPGLLDQLADLRRRAPRLYPLAVLLAREGVAQLVERGVATAAHRELGRALDTLAHAPDFLTPSTPETPT